MSHGQERRLAARSRISVWGRVALRLPVDLGGIAKVIFNTLNVVEAVERIGSGLAYRAGDARVKGIRHERVASTKAESADTAIAIDCMAVSMQSLSL